MKRFVMGMVCAGILAAPAISEAKKKKAAKQQAAQPVYTRKNPLINDPKSKPEHRAPKVMTPLEALTEEFSFVDLSAMKAAVAYLAKTYPAAYTNAPGYLAQISAYEKLKPQLDEKLKAADETVMAKCREILDFRREVLINQNPGIDFDQILFTKRKDYVPPNAYDIHRGGKSVGLPTNFEGNSKMVNKDWFSELGYIDIRNPSADPKIIYKPEDGSFIGDINLNFDADKMVFSSSDSNKVWQVFEIQADGSGLRQISEGEHPDIDNYNPIYLPDGRILFVATSGFQSVPCVNGVSPVGNFHIMNADGTGVRRLTYDQEADWYPTVHPSGQIMYTRWEYTDSAHFFTRIVMMMNPDGTGQTGYYGSNSYWPNALLYTKPLPGHPDQFIGIVSGHHGTRRAGELYIFDVAKGRKETQGVVQQIPTNAKTSSFGVVGDTIVDHIWPKFVHPMPITDKHFLVACKPTADSHWGLYYVDVFNNIVLLRQDTGYALMEPIPFRKTTRPPIMPDRVDLSKKEGTVLITDIYEGGLKDVPRGTVKDLRIFTYEYGYRKFASDMMVGIEGPWELHRIQGTVPVQEDGSVMFTMPANQPFAMQPLDADGRAMQIMRSWTMVAPGENASCIGCHEDKNMAVPAKRIMAANQAPEKIKPWYGPERGFSFNREVQPVLDRYCIGCHDGQPDRPDLRNVPSKVKAEFSAAYTSLHPFVRRPGVESDTDMQVPLNFHVNTSELIQMLRKGHHNVKVDQEGMDRITTWIDLNVPYLGTWSEFDSPKTKGLIRDNLIERRKEMAMQYGSIEPDTDVKIEADYDRTFIKPQPEKKQAGKATAQNWPFSADVAKKMQGDAEDAQLDLGNGVTLKLKRIPAGEFVMGAANESPWERPVANVKIDKPFLMGETEISLKQYHQFDPTHRNRKLDLRGKDLRTAGIDTEIDDLPVIRISWNEAMAFCEWLSQKTGKKVTLPSEAQWEWASRAGTDTPLSFGATTADFSPYANMSDYSTKVLGVKHFDTTKKMTLQTKIVQKIPALDYHPKVETVCDGAIHMADVGTYQPNAWGLKDMHGNVAEWTRNNLRPYPYRLEAGENDANTTGEKVVRGGSWYDRPKRCTSSYRLAYPEWQKVFNVGFRVIIEE